MDGPLLKSQRNQIFRLIGDVGGLSQADFDLYSPRSEFEDRDVAFKLIHRDTGFWFVIDADRDGDHLYSRSPSAKGVPGVTEGIWAKNWNEVLSAFANWIHLVQLEADEDDLWESYLAQPAPDPIEDIDNSHFSLIEQKRIKKQLDEVKEYLVSIVGSESARIEQINDRIAYLIESSERVGKKDWQMLALGTLMSLAQQLLLSQDQFRHIFEILKTVRLLIA